jgi:rubrerythrin
MGTEFEPIMEILQRAYQVEVDGFTFYSMAADRATKPAVRKLYQRLARDETEHKMYLRSVMKRYEKLGADSFRLDPRDPDLDEFSSQIFTREFKQQTEGELSEVGALSVGIQLERRSVEFFDTAAQQSHDSRISGFYRFLADWEGFHLRTLQHLYDSIRADTG